MENSDKNPDMEDWFLENCRRMAILNWSWKKLQWLLCYNSHKGLYTALVSFMLQLMEAQFKSAQTNKVQNQYK